MTLTREKFEEIMIRSDYGWEYADNIEGYPSPTCPSGFGESFEKYSFDRNLDECNSNSCQDCWKSVLNNYPWDKEV